MRRRRRTTDPVVAGAAAAALATVDPPEQTVLTGPSVTADPHAAAFFDVDNTVVRGASIFHLARGLYQREFFSNRDIARWAVQQAKFRLIGSEDLDHVEESREAALAFIRGRSVEELAAIGEEVYQEFIASRIWPGARISAQMHLDAGQRVWLVTATPVEVATVIARDLGLTGALGTVAESVDGVYTGRLVGEILHGEAKAEAVRALAEREDLDLSRCHAYSDSANDIPMLSLVGHAYAINPDRRLRAYAKAQGWQVRDYRRGRTAARIAVPAAAGVGAAAGGVAAGLAAHRRSR
jgi:HAD superfamily hydrolase (TIGR01490 family)